MAVQGVVEGPWPYPLRKRGRVEGEANHVEADRANNLGESAPQGKRRVKKLSC